MANEKNESKVFELLSRAESGTEITIRDDQNDFAAFLDSARLCREKGGRFRLIDTGKFGVFELEWLAQAGVDIYTSDEARPKKAEVELLAGACSKGQAVVAYFYQGSIRRNKESVSAPASLLQDISQSGAYLHLSNRDGERDFSFLSESAYACRQAGAWLVYYHYGRPAAGLKDLAGSGGWIHLSDRGFEPREDSALLLDVVKRAAAAGAGLVFHVEEAASASALRDVLQAGAFVLFKRPGLDYKSPLWPLQQHARRKDLDFRAYYLYTTILP